MIKHLIKEKIKIFRTLFKPMQEVSFIHHHLKMQLYLLDGVGDGQQQQLQSK